MTTTERTTFSRLMEITGLLFGELQKPNAPCMSRDRWNRMHELLVEFYAIRRMLESDSDMTMNGSTPFEGDVICAGAAS